MTTYRETYTPVDAVTMSSETRINELELALSAVRIVLESGDSYRGSEGQLALKLIELVLPKPKPPRLPDDTLEFISHSQT